MGTKSRLKRERREHAEYAASLTRCEGAWLERAPDSAELRRIDAAAKALREQRRIALEFHRDPHAAKVFSIELFRTDDFAPMHLEDWLIERIIERFGDPPVVEEEGEEAAFSQYLRQGVLAIATSRLRSALAAQLRRYLPRYAEAKRWKEAIAIDSNAFRTALGNEVSPFLVQMTLAGLADWYDAYESGAEDMPSVGDS